MKNILVTGGCGFIASNFINHFLKKYQNYVLVNLDAMYYCAREDNILEEIRKSNNYNFIKGSVCNKEILDLIFKTWNIDTVVHFAAQSHVDNSFSNPLQYTEDNIKGTHTLLECIREYPNSFHTCNARKNKSFLKNSFPRVNFDLLEDEIDPTWNENNNETMDSLLNRINVLHDFIEKNNYKNIALVGHNSYISMMKDQKFNRREDGLQELQHCFPYKLELKYN